MLRAFVGRLSTLPEQGKGRVLLVRGADYWRAVVMKSPPDREVRVMLMVNVKAKGDIS